MEDFDRLILAPVNVIRGTADETARWAWHGEWLEHAAPRLRVSCLTGVGHAPHHVDPHVLVDAIEAMVAHQGREGEPAVRETTSRRVPGSPGYAATRSRMA